MIRRSLVALAAAILLAAALPHSPGRAQQQATGSITLLRQTPFRTPDQPFTTTVRLRTSSPTAGLEVAIGTYRRLRSRSEFANVVDGRLPTRTPIDLVRGPVDGVIRDDQGNLVITIEPRVRQEGVYPVRVELREADGGNVVDGFTTFLVTVPASMEADPLDVALVLPVHAPPAVQADGEVDLEDGRADAIAELAQSLAASDVPLTLAPTGETLEALAESSRAVDRDTVTLLAQAARGRQVVTGTYVPTNVSDLLAAGLTGEVNAQFDRSATVTSDVLGVTPSSTVRVVEERIDNTALGTVQAQGVTTLVAPESVLEPIRPPNDVTLTATFEVPARRGPIEAGAADSALSTHFERSAPSALRAAHLLADLAVLWLDRPGRFAERRGVVAMPSRAWLPDSTFLDALLTGLSGNPILEPVTLDAFFAAVGQARTRSGVLSRSFLPPEGDSSVNTGAIRSARRRLEAFASIVSPDNPSLALLDRALLASMSVDLRAAERSAYVRGVNARIARELDAIETPPRRSITLTAREGELPVTITNRLPYPVTVVLTLDSDTLDFPGGAVRRLELTRENTTERFTVHARGSGSFPVRVRITAPEGGLLLAESRFTVRSTAVSGVGVALSVGAALFLVVWWASHLRGRRTGRGAERAE